MGPYQRNTMGVGSGDKRQCGVRAPQICGAGMTSCRASRRWSFHPRVAGEKSIKIKRIILEPRGLVNYKGIVGLFFPLFLSFGIRMHILCLSHYCILKVHNLSGFTSSQLESSLLQDKLYVESHLYLILMIF